MKKRTIREPNIRKKKSQFFNFTRECMWKYGKSFMWDLFSTVLLDTAVDVTQSSSGQHVGCLLVDQSVKVSLNLENVGDSGLKSSPSLHYEPVALVVNGESQCYW